MNNNAYVFNWLLKHGYKPHQAAGVVGNLVQESNVNPTTRPGDNGTAFGIAQWRGDRLKGLQSFAANSGTDWRDMDTQLGYLHHELNTTEKRAGDALRNANDVGQATAAVAGYERPRGFSWENPQGADGWNRRLSEAAQAAGTPSLADSFLPNPEQGPEMAGYSPPMAPQGAGGMDPMSVPSLSNPAALGEMMLPIIRGMGDGQGEQQAAGEQKMAERKRKQALLDPNDTLAGMFS